MDVQPDLGLEPLLGELELFEDRLGLRGLGLVDEPVENRDIQNQRKRIVAVPTRTAELERVGPVVVLPADGQGREIRRPGHLQHLRGHQLLVVELAQFRTHRQGLGHVRVRVRFDRFIGELALDLDRLLQIQAEERLEAELGGVHSVAGANNLGLEIGRRHFRPQKVELGSHADIIKLLDVLVVFFGQVQGLIGDLDQFPGQKVPIKSLLDVIDRLLPGLADGFPGGFEIEVGCPVARHQAAAGVERQAEIQGQGVGPGEVHLDGLGGHPGEERRESDAEDLFIQDIRALGVDAGEEPGHGFAHGGRGARLFGFFGQVAGVLLEGQADAFVEG